MIGGSDIIIPTTRALVALDLAVRAVMRMWPHVVLEDAKTGECLRRYEDIGFAISREILAFRDAEAAAQWEELGPVPSLDGTLIHFLSADHELTVAIDCNPSPQIKSFVQELRRGLAQELFASIAEKEAA